MFTRNRTHRSRIAQFGFTLIELAIVLGVVGILGAGLWRLMSSGTQQSKDSATAAQQAALIAAVKGFLASTAGQTWLNGLGNGNTSLLNLPTSNTNLNVCVNDPNMAAYPGFCNFLPPGFSTGTTNPYGQKYEIGVGAGATTPTQGYSFMILASGGPTPIPDTDGGRISGLIGGDGGFIYSSTVCPIITSLANTACGALGAWSASVGAYGLPGGSGSVASRTFVTTENDSSYYWLARMVFPGDTQYYKYNTMNTDLFMGAQTAPTQLVPGVPSIQLGNSNSVILAGTATDMAQISLVPTTNNGYDRSPIYISTGNDSLSSAACTNLNYYVGIGCPLTHYGTIIPAISVIEGDIEVDEGQILAKKLYSASDARLKTNIHMIQDPLDNLMKIDAVSFAFKKGGSQSMGVTAQNLEKVYPQLVSEVNGTEYVEYNGLIGPLIGAVQELKKQNDDLREQLHRQTLREDRLERELDGRKVSP